jgi:hypothetical protein
MLTNHTELGAAAGLRTTATPPSLSPPAEGQATDVSTVKETHVGTQYTYRGPRAIPPLVIYLCGFTPQTG